MSMHSAPARTHDPMCMGCGHANPGNLGVRVWFEGQRVHGEVLLDERHSGAPGYAHGGAIAAIMDDLLGQVLIPLDRPGVTATITVDFRGPALLGRTLSLESWCEKIDGRKLHMRGEIRDGDTLVAEARALFIHVDVSHWEASGQPLPESWQGWGGEAQNA
ncbi:PaaI family thioesterase [Paraconexibacter algicola]|nr:PaaI family thioesterase [Paraconexibacter algicola]